jgi:hypothetical protein
MKDRIEFQLEEDLKDALIRLKTSGKNVELEIQGKIENGELKIMQMDSYEKGPRSAPHCWHALTENVANEDN